MKKLKEKMKNPMKRITAWLVTVAMLLTGMASGIGGFTAAADADTTAPTLSNVTSSITAGGSVSATSSEDGKIYLVPKPTADYTNSTLTSLTAAAGANYTTATASTAATITTSNRLAGGAYQVYAVDGSDNVSTPSEVTVNMSNWADITTTISLTGAGTSENPYQIASADDLAFMAKEVDSSDQSYKSAYYKLTNDIDLSGHYWTPIGISNLYDAFCGNFDGGTYKIKGLQINKPNSTSGEGLFGAAYKSVINNVCLIDSNIIGNSNVGGIVGINIVGSNCGESTISNSSYAGSVTGTKCVGGISGNNFGTISNCHNAGTVNGANDPIGYVGGVAGNNQSGTIKSSYNTGSVTGDQRVGGVAGYSWQSSTITDCYNTGSVTGNQGVGGIAGFNYYSSSITDCYNTGTVTGYNEIGGVAGENAANAGSTSTVTNSYNTGSVTGVYTVGGVAGASTTGANTDNCYNTGLVTGTGTNSSYIGGVIGYKAGNTTDCYYCGHSGGIGGNGTAASDSAGETTPFIAYTSPLGVGRYTTITELDVSNLDSSFKNAFGITKIRYPDAYISSNNSIITVNGKTVTGIAAGNAFINGSAGAGSNPNSKIIITQNTLNMNDTSSGFSGSPADVVGDVSLPITVDNSTSGSVPTAAPAFTSAVPSPGSVAGTTKITVGDALGSGDKLAYKVSSTAIASKPNVGDTVSGTTDYNSGADIQNVDATTNKYVDLYELDSSGNVVKFSEIALTSAQINSIITAPSLSATASAGSATGTTKITVGDALGSGDKLAYKVSSSAIASTPNVGDSVSGTTDYTAGDNITGIDATTNKYVDLYELDSSGKVVKFSEIALTSAQINSIITAPSLSATASAGSATGTTKITVGDALGSGDKLAYKVSSSAIASTPNVGDSVSETTDYTAGDNITGVDATTNKYVDLYELDSSGKVVKFSEITLIDGEIAAGGSAASNWINCAASQFAGGTGTETDPYQIATAAQLAYLAKQVNNGNSYAGKYFKQTADIDLSGKDWTPIGEVNDYNNPHPFAGTFDGNGKAITGLTIGTSNNANNTFRYVGLFGYVGSAGTIENVGVDADIYSSSDGACVGILAGICDGNITGCNATGIVSGYWDTFVGGLAGTSGGSIINSYATGSVTGDANSDVGGLVGSSSGSIINSYATGNVTGIANIGGLVGVQQGTVTNCYASGNVSGGNNIGGIAGANSGTVTNSYWNSSASQKVYNADVTNKLGAGDDTGSTVTGTAKTSADMQSADFVTLLNNNRGTNTNWFLWAAGSAGVNGGYPVLTNAAPSLNAAASKGSAAGTTKITVGDALGSGDKLAYKVSSTPIASTPNVGDSVSGTTDYTAGDSITGVDCTTNKYIGVYELDSNGKVVKFTQITLIDGEIAAGGSAASNWINCTASQFAGGTGTETDPYQIATAAQLAYLAKQVNNGNSYAGKYFKQTADIDLSGKDWTPIGDDTHPFSGTFDGNGKAISNLKIGTSGSAENALTNVGLFGYIGQGAIVNNVGVDVEIYSSKGNADVGGLVGYCDGTITNCYSTGNAAGDTGACVGGLAGYCENCNITNCYSTDNATGDTGACVGGLAGYCENCNIANCYATGNATGDLDTDVGGLVGDCENCNVTNCYATGTVSGEHANIGGLVGDCENCNITNCYWNSTADQISSGAHRTDSEKLGAGTDTGTTATGTRETSDYMQSIAFVTLLNNNRGTNTNWFLWAAGSAGVNGGYPVLTNAAPSLSATASAGSAAGTTKITVGDALGSGDKLAYKVSSTPIVSTPNVGDSVSGTTDYTAGDNITGVDSTTNKYIGVYELDSNGKVVKLKQITLTDTQINRSSGGSTGGSTVPTKTDNTIGTTGSSSGSSGGTTPPTTAKITATDTNTSTYNNVIVNVGSVSVTAPASVFSSALGGNSSSWLVLSQDTTTAEIQKSVAAAAQSNGVTPVITLDVDLTRHYSDGTTEPVHQLSDAATVTISLTDAQVAAIRNSQSAQLLYYDPSTGKLNNMNATFDLAAKTATFKSSHFSTFVIVVLPVVTGVTNNSVYNSDKTITFDKGTATLDGEPFANGGTVSTEGKHTLVVTDTDGSTTVVFTIDKTTPVVSGVTDNGIYNEDKTITFNEGTATLDGSPFTSSDMVSVEGKHTLVVTDAAGNTATLEFVIDKSAPVVTVKAGKSTVKNGGVSISNVTVSVSDMFEVTKSVTLNGKACAWPASNTFSKDGKYVVTVKDQYGQTTKTTFTIKKSSDNVKVGITYSAHIQIIAWQKPVSNGKIAGTTGKSLRLEALKIKLTGNLPKSAFIRYQVYVIGKGWITGKNGTIAGTTGHRLRVEAVRITVSGLKRYTVKYKIHVQNKGWDKTWHTTKNGTSVTSAAVAGKVGSPLRVEAIKIQVVKA